MKICKEHEKILRRGMTYESSEEECEICKILDLHDDFPPIRKKDKKDEENW